MAWDGGEYLYAMNGEWEETVPHNDFARYHIPTGKWEDLPPIPVQRGVGDGGSLLWTAKYKEYIFALGGGDVDENPGYGFYAYRISSNKWMELERLPYPVGYWTGNRLGFANGHIYYWQGAPSTWPGDGNRFCRFDPSAAQLRITLWPSSVPAGQWTTKYTVERFDAFGSPVYSGETIVYLHSTSTGGNKKFSTAPGGEPVTSITIPDGSSSADFYYYDELAGTWTISVSADGLEGDSKPLTVYLVATATTTITTTTTTTYTTGTATTTPTTTQTTTAPP
ncbi:MAG: hypothetical protein QXL32_06470, partial [Candidatus Bathyarchaeia archaeon]